ncbi:Glycosyl transferase family 2 [Cyclobacterium lianum]|uniref:Glycosyl transferase family 2 n=1 Tax=Cyclobacterium lianum TaxID=388280 RepID=A0A1M7QL02_9BACT|nr:glycosyltransferase family 2 protein [Cyclobacterium lianum]SHN31770.1 Glycosyl transferase family 2 [Cyclobacterium lianum]
MQREYLVSIIITVYNKSNYIRESLQSALAQSYLNTEIIVIDDCSTDDSFDVVKQFCVRFSKIYLIRTQFNQGVSAATNLGIRAAKGEYIQFLDADDILSPDKIERQIEALVGNDWPVIATCEWLNFKKSINYSSSLNYGVFRDFLSGLDLLLRFWNHQEMNQPAVYLTHRKLVERAGPWDESLVINQDGEFFCRVLAHAGGVLYEPVGQVFYRQPGQENVSQQRSAKAARSLLDSYISYEKVILEIEDSHRVRTALKKIYLKFLYDTFPDYPPLFSEAKNRVKRLGIKQRVHIGGPKFQFMSKYLGFETALKLKRLIN